MSKKNKVITTIFLGLVLLGFLTLFLVLRLLSPLEANSQAKIKFVVPKGQSVTLIAKRLHEAKLITHPLVFRLVVELKGLNKKLQAGSFELSPALKPLEIALRLTEGTEDIWITIPEGWRAEEIAEYLGRQELGAFVETEFLELVHEGELEGQLFPDTYLVPREMTTKGTIKLLQDTYIRKTSALEGGDSTTSSKVLIMASIIQREARTPEQMRHVSGILWNRVKLGMALQVDATLQYIRGYDQAEKTWWPTPLSADRKLASPYNTYLHVSLPPAPICNPGLDAIEAALNPLEVDDLYYLHSPDGAMYYAQTFEGHSQNISNYLR
jgi:UPF0755 protein